MAAFRGHVAAGSSRRCRTRSKHSIFPGSIDIQLHIDFAVGMPAVEIIAISIVPFMAEIAAIPFTEAEAVVQMLFMLADIFPVRLGSTVLNVVPMIVDQRRTKNLIGDDVTIGRRPIV